MHETGLVRDLVKKIVTVVEKERAARAVRAKVRLGALSHMSADHFREHFEHESRGTAAEGAQLDVEVLTDKRDANAQDIFLASVDVENENRDAVKGGS